jgi:Skp family chaperone for outer membrane proteins
VPKNNMFKMGVATAAAAVAAILAITSVFAHTAPSTSGRSVVGTLVNAAHAASFPLFANEAAPNTLSDEQAQDEEEAAELAAKIAAEQQELAAQKAEQAAEAAAEAAEAAETDEDAAEVEDADNDTEQKTEHHDGGDHESD